MSKVVTLEWRGRYTMWHHLAAVTESITIANQAFLEAASAAKEFFSPKGFDISRLCHSNLSRSEDHSFRLLWRRRNRAQKRVHLRSILFLLSSLE